MPTVKGQKSPSERFAGAEDTYTIEALMQNGWALQSGTSHFLGQNFARAFDVFFQTEKGDRELVWATSWGMSTRLIGALVMTHSDDKGLVLPPPVAPLQVVIVPVTKGSGAEHDAVMTHVTAVAAALKKLKIRTKVCSDLVRFQLQTPRCPAVRSAAAACYPTACNPAAILTPCPSRSMTAVTCAQVPSTLSGSGRACL